MATDAPTRRLPRNISYPDDLPITEWHDQLLSTIADNQVVIVAGETGSGKSTQLPKMCLELGRGATARIGHTQPRRIAARAIAERVAEELGSTVGGLVGYTVRFTDEIAADTAVKVMTDGILLNEIQRDPQLRGYDTIIIDEAHERSLNIDFLIGYLARLIHQRSDLKVIITSATIDTERFAEHFDGAPVVTVEGRTYPVEIRYRPLIGDHGDQRDQSQAIGDAVTELASEGTGDILVFCSGEREIRDAVDTITDLGLRHTEVLPLFGRLSAAEQHRVFASHTGRRIVVATNVAETSLTVPGIRYVVDAGFARISRYSKRTKVQLLPIEPISRASANQRSGRCGRLGPGVAIRLYSKEDFDARPEFTDPEILRTSLASVMLQMAAIGLGPVGDFPFIDVPDTRTVKDGTSVLHELGAVGDGPMGTRAWLTDTGRTLARLPVDPRLGRMLIAAHENDCLNEVLTIASALSIQDPRERPAGKEAAADQTHARFTDASSDFLTWLKLWAYIEERRHDLTSGGFRRMCRKEFLHWRRVREWQELRAQLRRVARGLGMHPSRSKATPERVHEALLAGLLSHVGRKDPDSHEYRGARGTTFAIRPGSALFKRSPEWVMAAELVETTRTWATGVAPVDPTVVERVGAHLVNRSVSEPWWDPDRAAAVCRETTSLYGLTLSSDSIVLYDRYDPGAAREMFIRHALVLGEWETHHAFAEHNAGMIEQVLEVETRERRHDLLATDDALVSWFDERIPEGVTSAVAFDAWWKDERNRTPALLSFEEADVIDPHARSVDETAFPRVWSYGDLELDLTYEFDPGSDGDGVTVDIPLGALDRIDPADFEANVPGLRLELVTALIRSLPKQERKQFAPVPDTAAEILPAVEAANEPIRQALARILTQRSGQIIRPDAFASERLPPHLVPTFHVVDAGGDVVATGTDLDALRDQLRGAARRQVESATHDLERTGLTVWDFDDLPDRVAVGSGSSAIHAYPAIIDDGATVSIRLVASANERDDATWAGVRKLIMLALPSPRRLVRSVGSGSGPISVVGSPYPDSDAFVDDLLACAVDAAMAANGGVVLTHAGFERLAGDVKRDLADILDVIVPEGVELLNSVRALAEARDAAPPAFSDVVSDIERHVDRFLFDGCLTAVGAARIVDLRRYVDGATYRLGRVAEDPDRDRRNMAIVHELEDELDGLVDVLSISPALVEIDWMIQELRISLFAQPIGAKGPVSERRIRSALRDLLT